MWRVSGVKCLNERLIVCMMIRRMRRRTKEIIVDFDDDDWHVVYSSLFGRLWV